MKRLLGLALIIAPALVVTACCTPVAPTPPPAPPAITAGAYHALVRESDGSVWAWGRNNYGQLGDNSSVDSNVPVPVLGAFLAN